MKKGVLIAWMFCCAGFPLNGFSADTGIQPLLSTNAAATTGEARRVTAVYGISADDYLPVTELARQHLRPQLRTSGDHPAFDLPDGCYFVGGLVFLLILLRVLVIFIDDCEERRKEEMRKAASEQPPE